MRMLGWIFVPFVMIFKNWQQRSGLANLFASIFAVSMLSVYILLLLLSLNGGVFLSSVPSDLRGMDDKNPTAKPSTATTIPPTATTIPRTATTIPATATAIPPTATAIPPTATAIPRTATTQSQSSLTKTAIAKLAKTAAAKLP